MEDVGFGSSAWKGIYKLANVKCRVVKGSENDLPEVVKVSLEGH